MAEPVTAAKRPAEDEASAPQAKRLRDEPTETDEVGTRDVYRTMVDLNARADALERLLDDLKRAFDRDGTGGVPPLGGVPPDTSPTTIPQVLEASSP